MGLSLRLEAPFPFAPFDRALPENTGLLRGDMEKGVYRPRREPRISAAAWRSACTGPRSGWNPDGSRERRPRAAPTPSMSSTTEKGTPPARPTVRRGAAPALLPALLGALLGALGALAVGGGCATYPSRTAEALADFQRGHLESSQERFEDDEVVSSAFLSGAESGTVAMARGDWEGAVQRLQEAAEAAKDVEERALIDAEGTVEFLLSWGLNDTAKAYLGEGFERVYVHAQLAMAYLALGRLDSVFVETRRADRLLVSEERLYEKEYRAGGIGHFVSAVLYEILGEPDQAYVDYARMADKGVGTALAGRALVRIATQLGRKDDLPDLVERHGPDEERPAGAASVVVIAGVGLAPFKDDARLWIPTGDGVVPIAVPRYEERQQPITGLRLVELESGQAVQADVVEDVRSVLTENLEDRLAWATAKSAARGFLKRELTQYLSDEMGSGGAFVGNLFAIATERADLRSWQTLPDTWQGARLFVAPGVHSFDLEPIGAGSGVPLGTFELEPGETLLILARSVGTSVYAYPIGGRAVPPAAEPSQP